MNPVGQILDGEWLEADGIGGFASGTVGGRRTRRYHAMLLAATTPPTGRVVLINGLEVAVETPGGHFPLSTHFYAPGIVHPDGHTRLQSFSSEPWPTWTFKLGDGGEVTQELLVHHGRPETLVRWTYQGEGPAQLSVRPLISGRDYHSLHHENPFFSFEPVVHGAVVCWQPYSGLPPIFAWSNGAYHHQPDWYRNFLYEEEQRRGLDHTEDLASPGEFQWPLHSGEAVIVFRTTVDAPAQPGNGHTPDGVPSEAAGNGQVGGDAAAYARSVRDSERRRRRRLGPAPSRAADSYIVRRGTGRTVVAGYPWFTDWGRDTFIALRGLCIATGRLGIAQEILGAWADTVSQGMLPNLFPDGKAEPEYNSVDASLWYVIAVHDLMAAADQAGRPLSAAIRTKLQRAVTAIVSGYAGGTRYGIRMDHDGLLAAGCPGVQLTWMDAKIGDWVVTPRIGKPVEVQALWINALRFAGRFERRWSATAERALTSFHERFWNAEHGCLYDSIDVDHHPGQCDASVRPNQIFTVGGLPFRLLDGARARSVIDLVENRLWTPLGLRSLAPGDPDYRGRYEGSVWSRDSAYHQGTVWPWLIGPFVEAWLRIRDNRPEFVDQARSRFVQPMLDHLQTAGLGHVSEIADADAPHTPRGCPFQAWSLGELLRTMALLDACTEVKPSNGVNAAPLDVSTSAH